MRSIHPFAERKRPPLGRHAPAGLIALLVLLSLGGLIAVKEHIGFASFNGTAGTITQINLQMRFTPYWAGLTGIASWSGGVTQAFGFHLNRSEIRNAGDDLGFNCFNFLGERDLYASMDPDPDWTTLRAANISEIQTYLGAMDEGSGAFNETWVQYQNASNTFNATQNMSVSVGSTLITNIPTVYTWVDNTPNNATFVTGALIDGNGNLVFVTRTTWPATIGYNPSIDTVNFQFLLPVRNNSGQNYTIMPDPYDTCPTGAFGFVQLGWIDGTIFDNVTNATIPNATVYIDNQSNTTDANGYFNISANEGGYNFVVLADGYDFFWLWPVHVSANGSHQNASLQPAIPLGPKGNGTVYGTVLDNLTLLPLANVNVSIAGVSNLTDANGSYTLSEVPMGTHNILAFLAGYEVHYADLNVTANATLEHNISLEPIAGTFMQEGILNGTVYINGTNITLVNVTIRAAGETGLSGANGTYNLSIIEGTHTLLAQLAGYNDYLAEVNITALNVTTHDIFMVPSPALAPKGNGTVYGTVLDNVTLLPLANVNVSMAGVSNLTDANGSYTLSEVAIGTQNIVAFLTGYDVHYAELNITTNATLGHNISLVPIPAGAAMQEGILNGTVYINGTNTTLVNATIRAAGETGLSGANGTYNLSIIEGTHILLAQLAGYDNYIAEVNITAGNVTTHDIYLAPSALLLEGSVDGYVRDADTGTLLTNTTVVITHLSNLTDSVGFYNLTGIPPGEHYIVAIRSGYQINASIVNITANATTHHNISLKVFTEPGAGPGAGAGRGPGQGAGFGAGQGAGLGPGLGAGTGIIEKIGIDFYATVKAIVKVLSQATFAEESVVFYNLGKESKTVNIDVTGDVAQFVTLDRTTVTVSSNKTEELLVTLLATGEPGKYSGTLLISGDGNATIPIRLTILPREKLPIQVLLMELTLLRQTVNPGNALRYQVDLRNLLSDVSYDVDLEYSIRKEGSVAETKVGEDKASILTFMTLLNEYQMPDTAEVGSYLFSVKANYLNLTSVVSAPFQVTIPFYKYAILGVLPMWVLALIILGIALLTYGALEYRQLMLAKKRYVVSVEYNLLPKPGPRSLYLGKIAESERKAWFDMDQLTTHCIIAGSTGSGKSISAQVLVEEMLLKDIAVVVFDPTAQWSGMLRKLESPKMFASYPLFGMRKSDARAFNGNVRAITNARERIDLPKYIKPGEIHIFTLNRMDPSQIDIFVANTVRTVFRANFPESPVLKVLFVYDEVHRLLPRFGGSGEGFVQIERACREFRKWGLGVMLVSQVLSDFVGEIKANINTEIQMRTRDEGDLNRIKMKYGEGLLQSLVKAEVGAGMVVNTASNRGNPYFVAFRPILHSVQRLTDDDLELYNRHNIVIDDLDYQIEQLDPLGVDVFDLRLELKLALDKVKTGNFNMVEIYLESLRPRLEDIWRKLGQTPKKREVELLSETELKAELKKAMEERKKLEAEEATHRKVEVKKIQKFRKMARKFFTFSNGVAVSSLEELRDALGSMDEALFRDHVNEKKHDIADWVRDSLGLPSDADHLRMLTVRKEIIAHLNEIEEAKQEVILDEGAPAAGAKGPAAPRQAAQPAAPPAGPQPSPGAEELLRQISALFQEMDALLKLGKTKEAYETHRRINGLYQRLPAEVKRQVYQRLMERYKALRKK